MRAFRDGRLDVLISTTVIEVGIDVPDATAIAIIGAERYGLAQLHQLRGRVGRSEHPSYCLLVAASSARPAARDRLNVLVNTRSGSDVAKADLELRGPGDLLGSRQSGPLPLSFAYLIRDLDSIVLCRDLAERWLAQDPQLKSAQSAGARAAIAGMLEEGFSLGDVG